MKKVLFYLLILAGHVMPALAQNVFNVNDPQVRYDSTQPLGSAQRPDPARSGLQKWVSTATNGVSTSWNTSSYKAYFLRTNAIQMPYRIKFPRSFNNPDSVNKKYPVAVFLHGAAEVGCPSNNGVYNNEQQLILDGKLFGQWVDNNQFDGFLVYPHFVTTSGCFASWNTVPIQNLHIHFSMIDSMAKYIRADIDRVVITGLSGGGYGAWRMAQESPQRVTKIMPSAAAGTTTLRERFVHLPIWFATGGKDPDPSPAQAAYAFDRMNDIGADIRYTQYPDLGHAVWGSHWAEPDFVVQMNDMHKANPLVFFKRNEFCPSETIAARLGITADFYAYEWQRDGVTIASSTNSVNTIVLPEHVTSFTGNEIIVKSIGTYRVRFKRTASGPWSVFSPKPVVVKIKQITQTAAITVNGANSKVLPALDGKTTAPLQLPAGFINYEWYRVSDNVQVGNSQTLNAPVGVYRARYSEQNGCGTTFSPNFTVVNANNTPKPDAPSALTTSPLSRTSIRLNWSQGNGETGFEIYRAAKAGGPYTFIALTTANTATYTNASLEAGVKYYYIIRAVSETGASAATSEAAAKTLSDNVIPTTPGNLQYRGSTSTSVLLKWTASTDEDGIARYDIYANGIKMFSTTSTSFNVFNLDSLKSYAFTVKAVDKNNNESPASNQVTGYTHRAGINYKYYTSPNYWTVLPDFNSLTPVKSGVTDSMNINNTSIKTDILRYGFLWEGFIYIPVTATYTFETVSDDGTKVYIDAPYSFDGMPLISNDGVHGMVSKTGTITLSQGYHSIAVAYFQGNYGYGMEMYWSNNTGLAREKIPKNFFSAVSGTVSNPNPPQRRAGINYKYYTSPNFWTVLPDFNSLTPVKTGVTDSMNINNTSIKTDILRYGFLWEGFIYIPTTATYTFETVSDDGTKVYIDAPYSFNGTPLISNDGVHGMVSKTGTITLTQGYHSIAVAYFQGNYGYGMEMYWSNNAGLAREKIPKNAFTYEDEVVSNPNTAGINYKYYTSPNFWTVLPDFNSLTPVKSGVTDSININNTNIKTDILRYGFLWQGFIYIPATATYTFETISDDGTKVYIDVPYSSSATPLISNDGVHGMVSKTGTIALSQGYHSIAIAYFQGNYGYGMEIYWSNNAGLARQRIPKNSFTFLNGPVNPEPRQPSELSATTLTYNKINLNWIDNSSTEKGFEIFRSTAVDGAYVVVGRAPANTTSFIDSALTSATTYYYQLRAISDSAESVFTTAANATTAAMPLTPIAPSKLEAEGGGGNTVALSWDDNSTNETNFRIYRSVDGTNYQLVVMLNANANAYTDVSTTALTSYYYYVVGSNGSGIGEKSNTVRFKAGNNAPVFSGLANLFAKTGQLANEDFVVSDDAGDAVTVTIADKPAFVNVANVSGNNFRLTANPSQDNVGWYTLTLIATDNYGRSTSAVATITVADNKTRSLFVKLGTQAAAAPWNNWTGSRAAGSVINSLKDENNITTAISLTSLTTWSGVNTLGHITGNNSGIVPDAVLDNGIADNGAAKQFRFSGLNQAMRYNVSFVGSMNEGLVATTQYTSGTESSILDARYNTNKSANLNGLIPDTNGQIVVTITRTGTSEFSYLNAIILEEYAPATAMLNPENLYAEALDRNRITLSWSDRTNGEASGDGFQVQRATDSLFTQNVVNIALPANTTSYINTGLVPNTKYWYRVRSKNGTTFSEYSNKYTVVTPASIVYVNFNTSITNAAAPWNNLQRSPMAEMEVTDLKDQSGASSNISIRLNKVFNGEFTAGLNTGNNSGVVPDNVLASSFWLDNLQIGQFKLSGLNHSRRYRIGFVGSSSSTGWFKGNYTAAYTINGRTVYLNSWMNSTKVVYISDVVPNAAGEVVLDFSTSAAGQWAFNSGIIIHEYTDKVGGSILYMSNSELDKEPLLVVADRRNVMGYPNPFADNINVVFTNLSASDKITTEVYDMYGRLIVRQDHANLIQGRNLLKIRMPGAAQNTGMFIVTLKINGRIERTIKMLRKRP